MDYHIARNGQQLGVFAEQEIQSGITSGQFFATDLFWAEGMADWQPVSSRFQAAMPLNWSPPVSIQDSFNPYAAPSSSIIPAATAHMFPPASHGQRLGAAALDFLIHLIASIPLIVGIFSVIQSEKAGNPEFGQTFIVCLVVWLIASLVILVCNIVFLTTRGQTIGKKLVGIHIVTYPDCRKAGFVKACLLRAVVNTIIIQVIPIFGFIYWIVDDLFIFRDDRRCIHDLLADTHVVQGHPPD